MTNPANTEANTMNTEIARFLKDREKMGTARATVLAFRRQGVAAENDRREGDRVMVWDASLRCYWRHSTTDAGRILHGVLSGKPVDHAGGVRMDHTWAPYRVIPMITSTVKKWEPGQV